MHRLPKLNLNQRCVIAFFSNDAASSSTRPNLSSDSSRRVRVFDLCQQRAQSGQTCQVGRAATRLHVPLLMRCKAVLHFSTWLARSGFSFTSRIVLCRSAAKLGQSSNKLVANPTKLSEPCQASTALIRVKVCNHDLSLKATASGMSTGTP